MKKIVLFILCISYSFFFSQQNCVGILIDSLNAKPIEFANIGIIGKGVGTVTNEKGEFNFVIPDSLLKFPVKVSMIGYRSKVINSKYFSNQKNIQLVEQSNVLDEVKVVAKKSVTKILGNQTKTTAVVGSFKENKLGAEMGIKLKIKKTRTHIKTFYLNIAKNQIEKLIFRFNVYNLTEKGYPKDNILTQNIMIEPKDKIGLIEFDLMPYNIFVNDDVIVSVEWVKDLGNTNLLGFSTKLIGSDTYFRRASQDIWEKSSVGVGIYVEVAY